MGERGCRGLVMGDLRDRMMETEMLLLNVMLEKPRPLKRLAASKKTPPSLLDGEEAEDEEEPEDGQEKANCGDALGGSALAEVGGDGMAPSAAWNKYKQRTTNHAYVIQARPRNCRAQINLRQGDQ